MSKRTSVGQKNTLFNYFQSPQEKKTKKQVGNGDANLNDTHKDPESNDSDEELKVTSKKRNRIIIDSDSSDGESAPQTPASQKRPKLNHNDSNTTIKSFSLNKSVSADRDATNVLMPNGEFNWLHKRLDFLKPNCIRDINKNRPGDPDYDEKTLYVPEDFLSKQTPAMRQWWLLKSTHFDTVLFFKVGKFYEFYHMDAVIGVNNLGFSYMKGDFAHSGFPESAYGRMASSLIEQGFKVARIEQTETPEMMAERCKTKKSGKFDKVVNREICQISTKATCIYGAQMTDAKQVQPYHMIAVAESPLSAGSRFGVCFIDTSIGTFHLGEFDDDRHCSRLLALFAQHTPALILLERGRLQQCTLAILKKAVGDIKRDFLTPNKQFLNAQNTLDTLCTGCYFRDKDDKFEWPPVLCDLIDNNSPKFDWSLALKSLGACLWYLRDSELDIYMLSMKKFEIYEPVDGMNERASKQDFMVLDHVTMKNLNLLDGAGSLQNTLDYCSTPFGKRLLQQWICRPLCDVDLILERQCAVEELYLSNEIRQAVRGLLSKLPDLPRQISKIHIFGNRFCTKHPDSRAVLYEEKTYSKRKIMDLIRTMQGLEKAQEVTNLFKGCSSSLLIRLTQPQPEGCFLDISETLQYFRKAFDQKKAETDGKIIPQSGVDDEYDEAEEEIAKVHQESVAYLEELQEMFHCKVVYFGTDKKRFQIEVPEKMTHKVTSEFQLESSRKGSKPCKRYSTATSRQILADMIRAETRRNKIVQDLNRRIFEKFSDNRNKWEQIAHCLKLLDVLCSFAEYARTGPQNVCFPEIFSERDTFIDIEDGVHPCINLENFVPNSTELGVGEKSKLLLLTGPNMGGKSTLMRQVALIIIMAQMGCAVPATKCKLTLVDRIFTRLGANDEILKNQSTFLVELSEAAAILRHATKDSFVLIDELGRGTSTHDGNAIATAYLSKLVQMRCRTIFSTHYHSLVDCYQERSGVQLGHMACMTDDDRDEDDPMVSVTLLYQLKEGNCPKSYGFNAAKLAGLPLGIIKRAHKIATNLERINNLRKEFRSLILKNDLQRLREMKSH